MRGQDWWEGEEMEKEVLEKEEEEEEETKGYLHC